MVPRRSALYLPGANTRALDKARTLACDALIFDLEDAVAPASKAIARGEIENAFRKGTYGSRERILRVNGLDTPWGKEDLDFAATVKPDAVLFPKVSSAAQLEEQLAQLDAANGTDLSVWLMIETPLGILNVASIASSSNRIQALVLGTSDLVKELRARHTSMRQNLAFALQQCVTAARAANVDVIDGVHLDFRNLEAFTETCKAARDMGFDGKTLIHPSQIEIANEVFGISADEIDHASQVLDVWRAAQSRGSGVAELNGQLIENLHAAEAERTLEFSRAIKHRARVV